jgi:DNA helicase-2/ATP-dependent DNA helicase PcrA
LDELPDEPMEHQDRSGIVLPERSPGRSSPYFSRGSEPPHQPAARQFRLTTAAELTGAGAGNPPVATAPIDLDAFRPGTTVVHPEYGIGRVISIDGAGPDRKGRVAFTLAGERTFVLARSPLRLLSKPR